MKQIVLFTLFLIAGNMMAKNLEKATFAGGCFWCMEHAFEEPPQEGIIDVVSGYTGGDGTNPNYTTYAQQDHIEAVQITFDPQKISYQQLLDIFWRNSNPTDPDGQFVDRGKQYSTAIFYHNAQQKQEAEQSKQVLEKSGRFDKPIVTPLRPAENFYPAENYHQDYHKNHSWRYWWYYSGSGRDQFIKKHWNKKLNSDAELRAKLTPLQYQVTQNNGTEPAFNNEYWDNTQPGIYVDIVSGEPLFSSLDKFKSGTGWPSFTKPLEPDNIIEKLHKSWFTTRREVRSKHADSHLGDIFDDGPPPTGQRYCINSAALRFIPLKDLERAGYGQYKHLFEN